MPPAAGRDGRGLFDGWGPCQTRPDRGGLQSGMTWPWWWMTAMRAVCSDEADGARRAISRPSRSDGDCYKHARQGPWRSNGGIYLVQG